MAIKILLAGMMSVWCLIASASVTDTNQDHAAYLNANYTTLQLRVPKAADPSVVKTELELLEDALRIQKATGQMPLPSMYLIHISCTSAPCGGCSNRVCLR